jgi:tetratricopeptide (TPR) repeat protein
MKHDELQEDLASHLRAGTDRMVWTNTQLGPSGSPRPDVFTINKSFSRFRSDCYEIKVSVSDLRHDVTSGKWQSYRKFGHAVWFAFPRGMAPLDLIPKECGIILRGDGGWRAARKPVAQVLDTLPRDTWLKLLLTVFPDRPVEPRIRHAQSWRAEELVRKKLGDELAALFSSEQNARNSLKYRIERHQKALADIDEAEKSRRERMRADDLREATALDGAIKNLAKELGLDPEKANASEVTSALWSMRRSLAGQGIGDAIQLLQRLQGAMPEKVA